MQGIDELVYFLGSALQNKITVLSGCVKLCLYRFITDAVYECQLVGFGKVESFTNYFKRR